MTRLSLIQHLRAWSALLPLLLLLAAAYWLDQQVQPLPLRQDSGSRHDPDFIVSQFSATLLNKQGTPHYMITAREMSHYPDDDNTYLESLELTSLVPGRPAMHVSASSGNISGKGDEIILRDDVRIVRAASARQSELVITTDYLRAIPEQDRVETDRPVTIADARNRIQAVGMQMDNKARTIRLLAQVNSYHEVSASKSVLE